MKYKYIFWDWNGTLFNDTATCHLITNQLLKEMDLPEIELDYYRKKLRHPIKEFYREIITDDKDRGYEWFADRFHEIYELKRIECKLHDFAEDCIDYIKSKNGLQSILSAHPQNLLDSIIAHLSIGHHFTHIIGASDNLAAAKFREGETLMKLHNADPGRAVLIGDTQHDAEVAEMLGIDCILVAQGMQCKTRLSGLAYPIIDSLQELKAFLE